MISVLIPTRKRPKHFRQAVDSLGGNIEVLAYIDQDDDSNYDFTGCRVTKGQRFGYDNLHQYYNLLAAQATGDWLMLWNDDALMETELWQDKIWRYNHTKPHVLTFHEIDNLFPIISKVMYDIVGHYSLSPHVDSWVQEVGAKAGIQTLVPDINIKHLREEMNDDTYREGREHIRITSPEFNSAEMIRLRDKDIAKIKNWMGENQ